MCKACLLELKCKEIENRINKKSCQRKECKHISSVWGTSQLVFTICIYPLYCILVKSKANFFFQKNSYFLVKLKKLSRWMLMFIITTIYLKTTTKLQQTKNNWGAVSTQYPINIWAVKNACSSLCRKKARIKEKKSLCFPLTALENCKTSVLLKRRQTSGLVFALENKLNESTSQYFLGINELPKINSLQHSEKGKF